MCKPECDEWDDSVGSVPQVIEQRVYEDARGIFAEIWQRERQAVPSNICQINHSTSVKNTIRGLHWQVAPHGIGKYVTCLRGMIDDVVVDLRKRSKTFGQWKAYTLTPNNPDNIRKSVWVPSGFAHGFVALAETPSEVMYMQDGLWHKDAERSLRWDDPDVGINWGVSYSSCPFVISKKDSEAPFLQDLTDHDLFL